MTELSSSVSRHGLLCRDMVLRLQAWLCCDRGFPCRDRVVFLWFSFMTGVLPKSGQCFILCRDRGSLVATEMAEAIG